MKNCPNCNAQLEEDVVFCPKCGQHLNPPTEDMAEKENKCPKCGVMLEKGAVFCANCGERIESNVPVETTAAPINTNNPVQNGSNKRNVLLGILAIVVAVFIGFAFVKGSNGGKDSALSVKADEMLEEFIQDREKAEKKYKNVTVHVTGKVDVKNQFSNSKNYFMVVAKKKVGDLRYRIFVDVGENVNAINKVNQGDFVSVKGRCVGIVPQKDPNNISIQIQSTEINN